MQRRVVSWRLCVMTDRVLSEDEMVSVQEHVKYGLPQSTVWELFASHRLLQQRVLELEEDVEILENIAYESSER